MNTNSLVRTNDKLLAGVCAGLGKRLNINLNVLRLLFIISSVFFVFPVFVYGFLWFNSPYQDTTNNITKNSPQERFFNSGNIPRWFIYYNYFGLYPILFWPLIFYASIFLFDNPSNIALTYGIFFSIIMYPVAYLGILSLSSRLFHRFRLIAVLLPTVSIVSGVVFLIFVFGDN